MEIPLASVLKIDTPESYKVHFAVTNTEGVNPLTVFADWQQWRGWNSWRRGSNGEPGKSVDDFSRERIFSLIRFRPMEWLFGGIFVVRAREKYKRYEIEDAELGKELIGRLVVSYERPKSRGRAFNFENHYGGMNVLEILPQIYEGEAFPRLGNISHQYAVLEPIFRREAKDWKAGLDVRGVYLITDRKTSRLYVGSATSSTGGIWGRWRSYILGDGDGGNVALKQIVKAKGKDYVRQNFYFSILQVLPDSPDEEIILREGHWKCALNTRDSQNYNRN